MWSKEDRSKESRSKEIQSEEIARGRAAVRVLARLAAMGALVVRAAHSSFARMKRAQALAGKRKQMKLVESLALGNRRQLLLVVCDNQRYLVGAGADSVGSILPIAAPPIARERPIRSPARGPELVRRKGRDMGRDAGWRSAEEPGLNLWH